MKTKILLLSALSGFISILTSCYREIDVEKYRTTPKIVINCPISPDTVIRASITRTYFFQIWTSSNLNTMAGTGKQKFQV